MPKTRHITSCREGDVLVLVGTMKGVFVLKSSRRRASWETAGPYFPGQAIYALAYDGRAGAHRLWAGAESGHWGPALHSSDDFGHTWSEPAGPSVRFPENTGLSLKRIWQIRPGREGEPQTLYCGVEPAALFESQDAGVTWSLVTGLHEHPHRPRWEPGGGGLCLHTILPDPTDPNRLRIAISTGGVYRTDDGGASWKATNQGIRAVFRPDKYPEFGQCVHKVVQPAARPERLFLQNHWGLYRSDDGGNNWKDIANGVPSDFGFTMVAHPHEPDTVYIVPIESDQFRCTPEGKLRVYRTRNAGKSWEPLSRGLPQKSAYETVLRDAMDADTLTPAGIYFGTRSGKVFASRNDGNAWKEIAQGLPPVVCVRAALVTAVKARAKSPAPARKVSSKAPRSRRRAA